jgi:hypothetical protein
MPPETRKKNYRAESDKTPNKNNKKVKQTPNESPPIAPVEKEPLEMELDVINSTFSATAPLNAAPNQKTNPTASTSKNKGKGKADDVDQAYDATENLIHDDKNSETSSTANYTFTSRATSYPAIVPIEAIPGKSITDRKNECARIFSEFPSFTGCAIIKKPDDTGNTKSFMRIFFSDSNDCNAATQVKLPNSEEKFLAEADSDTNRKNHAACSVKVTQIPLNISQQMIDNAFNKYGKVVQIVMNTKNAWQSATVTFDKADAVQQFNDIWGIYILRDMVTVTPFNIDYNESYIRSAYCLRLTGLPSGTNARDLDEIGKAIKAKTWTIPRSKFNYNYLRYAFFNFATEQDCIAASNSPMGLGSTKLAWAQPDAQLCGRCASAHHLSKDCPERRPAINQEFAKLYAKFRPAQFRNFQVTRPENNNNTRKYQSTTRPQNTKQGNEISKVNDGKSYAYVTNPKKHGNDNNNSNNLENGTKRGGSMHETTQEFDAAGAHRTLLKHLSDIKSQMRSINLTLTEQDKRIKIIEELNGIKTTLQPLSIIDNGMEVDGNDVTNAKTSSSKKTTETGYDDNKIDDINAATKELQAENTSLKETLATIAGKYNELIDVLGSATSTKIEKISELFISSLTQPSPNTSNNE